MRNVVVDGWTRSAVPAKKSRVCWGYGFVENPQSSRRLNEGIPRGI